MRHPLLPQSPLDRLIFALDVETPDEALDWAARLAGSVRWLKVGPKLFTAAGPALLDTLVHQGYQVFLDLKFHDIPDVVAGAVREATRRRVSLITLHASGGERMMQAAAHAAREEAGRMGTTPPILLGVTVLTSLGAGDLEAIGFALPPEAQVPRLAALAHRAGLDGVVCSPREISLVKGLELSPMVVLTPGIRPATRSDDGRPAPQANDGQPAAVPSDDQVRISTPAEAIRAGADFLVVGRPIRLAPDPRQAIDHIVAELS